MGLVAVIKTLNWEIPKIIKNEGSWLRLFMNRYPVTPKGSDIPAQGNALGWVCV